MASDVTHPNVAALGAAEAQQKTSPAFRRLVVASGWARPSSTTTSSSMRSVRRSCRRGVLSKLDSGCGHDRRFCHVHGRLPGAGRLAASYLAIMGDKIGRKAVLTLTLLIMGVASMLIGCVPGYMTWGLWAPIALSICRFIQGIAFGAST